MKTFSAGGRALALAPFTIDQAEEVMSILEAIAKEPPPKDGDVDAAVALSKRRNAQMVDTIAIALRRGEPGGLLSRLLHAWRPAGRDERWRRWMKSRLSYREIVDLYAAVMDASGLRQDAPAGEAKSP